MQRASLTQLAAFVNRDIFFLICKVVTVNATSKRCYTSIAHCACPSHFAIYKSTFLFTFMVRSVARSAGLRISIIVIYANQRVKRERLKVFKAISTPGLDELWFSTANILKPFEHQEPVLISHLFKSSHFPVFSLLVNHEYDIVYLS